MQQDTPASNEAKVATASSSTDAVFIVGIDSSAGGLEALGPLVGNLSSSAPVAYVIVQHLAPQHRSMPADLLSRETTLRVEEIRDGTTVRAGVVYTTPPNNDVVFEDGRLRLHPPGNAVGPKPSADRCFHSLAAGAGTRAIGVILSGTGSDGAFGAREIKRVGGLVIAQKPSSARYDGMPKSAIDTGAVDAVLDPPEIGRKLTQFARTPDRDRVFEPPDHDRGVLRDIIAAVERITGVDFSGYKSNTINRRLARRVAATGSLGAEGYLSYLRQEPSEAHRFVQDALISVTSFFRDPEMFNRAGQAIGCLRRSRTTSRSASGCPGVRPARRRTRWRWWRSSAFEPRGSGIASRCSRPTSTPWRSNAPAAARMRKPPLGLFPTRCWNATSFATATATRSGRTCATASSSRGMT